MRHRSCVRSASTLVVIAGLAAMLAGLVLAFLTRMRLDAEDALLVMREAQARIMLIAACNYVQEASRLGYDPDEGGATPVRTEAFGWIDVRDGAIGPKDQYGTPLWTAGAWPAVGTAVRCPMHALRRPPCATRMTVAYNPIATDEGDPAFGLPYLQRPDPQPAVPNYGTPDIDATVSDALVIAGETNWDLYLAGDPRPRPSTTGLAWFRCYRDSPATFVVTCGAGATLGFRAWVEMGPDDRAAFGDREGFATALAAEVRTWYRIEWSAAVQAHEDKVYDANNMNSDMYMWNAVNVSGFWGGGNPDQRRARGNKLNAGWQWAKQNPRNLAGTIRWVQRLREPPTNW